MMTVSNDPSMIRLDHTDHDAGAAGLAIHPFREHPVNVGVGREPEHALCSTGLGGRVALCYRIMPPKALSGIIPLCVCNTGGERIGLGLKTRACMGTKTMLVFYSRKGKDAWDLWVEPPHDKGTREDT